MLREVLFIRAGAVQPRKREAGVGRCDSLQDDMRRDIVAATLGMGALVGVLTVHLLVASSAGGPVAVPDVPAYLSIAQWIGSDGLAPENLPFQPGFSLLLAPLVWVAQISELSTQGESVHYIALVANSMAATVAVAVAGWLGWRMSGRWWVCVAGAAIAAVHPSLSSASRIAWPETLLALAVLASAGAIARAHLAATTRSSQRSWAVAGLIATLAVALHARAVVLVVAVVVTAAVTRTGRRTWLGTGGRSAGGRRNSRIGALADRHLADRSAQRSRRARPRLANGGDSVRAAPGAGRRHCRLGARRA